MSGAPLVSVVIPCRDSAGSIAATIESVLGQDYPAIECIVADGGSADGTLDVVRRFEGRLRWFSQADRGPFDAINRGWRESGGAILAWLNADDRWEPGAVATAVATFEGDPGAAVVYGGAVGVDVSGREAWRFRPRPWRIEDAILRCDHVVMQAAAFVRREWVEERAGWLYPSWTHDHELWLRIGLAGGRFVTIDRSLARIRVSAGDRHQDPSLMVPARLAMTRRVFRSPLLPLALVGREREALARAWVSGLDLLSPTRPSHWPWCIRCVAGALRTDPRSAPDIARVLVRKAGYRIPAFSRNRRGSDGRRTPS